MQGETATDRKVLRIGGADRVKFLQGLVSNDVKALPCYAALLTPQGKFLADFILSDTGDAILMDVRADLAPALKQRLTMYKLRADVAIDDTDLHVLRGLDEPPEGGFADPRHPDLGWRAYSDAPGSDPTIDWDAIRVAHVIPEAGVELIPNDSYILECGFEPLHGVNFKKGCYVGQEVTARMKHKTTLRKGLVGVEISEAVPVGTQVTTAEGKDAGTVFTQSGGQAIAYLRFDRAEGAMQAGTARVRLRQRAV